MVFIHTSEQDVEFVKELLLDDMPDRVIAILSAVILDERLLAAIQNYLHDMPIKGSTVFLNLFRDGAPLGSFKPRIDIGFALGLYGAEVYSDLCIINKIRNKFAHTREVKNFDTQSIKNSIENLKTPDSYPISSGADAFTAAMSVVSSLASHMTGQKQRFVRAVEVISLMLQIHASSSYEPKKPKFP